MAKAILGHVGGPDPRLMAEVARLRRRVSELEAELTRLSAENQALLTQSLDGSLPAEIITLGAASTDRTASIDRSAPALA